jgi:hypothetical protein
LCNKRDRRFDGALLDVSLRPGEMLPLRSFKLQLTSGLYRYCRTSMETSCNPRTGHAPCDARRILRLPHGFRIMLQHIGFINLLGCTPRPCRRWSRRRGAPVFKTARGFLEINAGAKMPKIWPYEEACIVAGELYGNLLARDSDEAGYRYNLNQLLTGEESVRDIVIRFCASEEFREKYVMNQTPNELARRLALRLAMNKRPSPEEIKALAIALLERDWRAVVTEVIRSNGYTAAFGEDRVPVWA